jgi:hypothetical protein
MPALLDKPPCLHRERAPARECESCGAYLTSASEDDWCFQCGGWTTQRLNALEAMPSAKGNKAKRECVGAALEELMAA